MLEIINYNTNPRLNLTNATYPTAIQKIDNITSLRNYEPTFDKQVIFLLGKTVVGVASSNYRSDFSDTSSADNNDTVIVTIGGKRWKKIIASGGGGGGGDLLSTNNLSDVASTSASRTNLGLAIGTNVQAYSAILDNTTASFTTNDKTKLDTIAMGAEVNQNTFSTISVAGQSDVVADSKTDTLTLVAGTNVTITTNATTDAITISSSGGTGGLLSANNLSDVANVSTSRTNLGLAIGTNVQAYSSILQATTASFTTALQTTINTNTTDITGIKAKTDFITISASANIGTMQTDISASKTKTDLITISSALNLNTMNTNIGTNTSDITAIKVKTDNLTVPSAVNTDTLKSDILSAKTKTDFLTISANANIGTMQSDITSAKTKTDLITVSSSVNLNTMNTTIGTNTTDITGIKTKTDFITVSTAVNLNTINSYIRNGIETFTANGTIATTTILALVNSASDITVTLALANSLPTGTFVNVKRLGTGNVIIAPNGSNNIDGANTSYNFNADSAVRYSSRRLVTNGTADWYLI
jgi:hypothetical protein